MQNNPTSNSLAWAEHVERNSTQETIPVAFLGGIAAAFVMPVRLCRSELEFSPGVSPRNDCTACALGKRFTSSMAATKRMLVVWVSQFSTFSPFECRDVHRIIINESNKSVCFN